MNGFNGPQGLTINIAGNVVGDGGRTFDCQTPASSVPTAPDVADTLILDHHEDLVRKTKNLEDQNALLRSTDMENKKLIDLLAKKILNERQIAQDERLLAQDERLNLFADDVLKREVEELRRESERLRVELNLERVSGLADTRVGAIAEDTMQKHAQEIEELNERHRKEMEEQHRNHLKMMEAVFEDNSKAMHNHKNELRDARSYECITQELLDQCKTELEFLFKCSKDANTWSKDERQAHETTRRGLQDVSEEFDRYDQNGSIDLGSNLGSSFVTANLGSSFVTVDSSVEIIQDNDTDRNRYSAIPPEQQYWSFSNKEWKLKSLPLLKPLPTHFGIDYNNLKIERMKNENSVFNR